jgi:hypothetical protein
MQNSESRRHTARKAKARPSVNASTQAVMSNNGSRSTVAQRTKDHAFYNDMFASFHTVAMSLYPLKREECSRHVHTAEHRCICMPLIYQQSLSNFNIEKSNCNNNKSNNQPISL